MINKELEKTINEAIDKAQELRSQYITLEHLLFALIDNVDANEVLKVCGANLDSLRSDIDDFIKNKIPRFSPKDNYKAETTIGFQRVIRRAIFHVQSTGKKEVDGANILVAIFSETESNAIYFLHLQNISKLDIVNYISHGIHKNESDETDVYEDDSDDNTIKSNSSELEKYAINLNSLANSGKIDPLIGRQLEVQRTIEM